MTQHAHQHSNHQHGHGAGHHRGQHAHPPEAGLVELLDLDAEVVGSYLNEVTDWVAEHTPDPVHTAIDIGAGTGSGSFALARRFPTAEVVAIDRSDPMLERLRTAAQAQGLADRVRPVRADLDVEWPDVRAADLAWASSSLHEVSDPDRTFRDIYDALNPGGLMVAIEMDTLPRFLPEDIGIGRPGLEARCHEALVQLGWNAHPDWRSFQERAGLEFVDQHRFVIDVSPVPPVTGRYAKAYLGRIRSALDGQLDTPDLDALDRLLSDDDPASLTRRDDLTVRGSRTAWAARRPAV